MKVLHLQGNQIGVAGIQALLSAEKLSAVEEFRGSGVEVVFRGLRVGVCGCTGFGPVQELYLVKLEDREKNSVLAQVLAGKFKSEVLDLQKCGVSDYAAQALAYSLRYNTVT